MLVGLLQVLGELGVEKKGELRADAVVEDVAQSDIGVAQSDNDTELSAHSACSGFPTFSGKWVFTHPMQTKLPSVSFHFTRRPDFEGKDSDGRD